jgi:hypothetical protein
MTSPKPPLLPEIKRARGPMPSGRRPVSGAIRRTAVFRLSLSINPSDMQYSCLQAIGDDFKISYSFLDDHCPQIGWNPNGSGRNDYASIYVQQNIYQYSPLKYQFDINGLFKILIVWIIFM